MLRRVVTNRRGMTTSTALVAVTRAMTAFIARTVERKLSPSTSFAIRRPMSSRRGDARAVTARADIGRERASELASGSDFGRGDESDDPLVHMGRVNKSALKRIGARGVVDPRTSVKLTGRRVFFGAAQDQKALARSMLALPKSQVTQLKRFLPEDVVELTLQGGVITRKNRVAFKRHEGTLARRLRALTDGERDALVRAISEIESGTSGTMDPGVEATATAWRNMLLKGSEQDASKARDEIFAALDAREAWAFTRQELMRAVVEATKEHETRVEQIARFNAAVDEEMKILVIGIQDEEALKQTRAYAANTLRNRKGSGFEREPAVTKSRALLKLLRDVAQAAQ